MFSTITDAFSSNSVLIPAMLAFIITLIAEIVFLRKHGIKTPRSKRVESAKQNGRIVTAVLTHVSVSTSRSRSNNNRFNYAATYEYILRGNVKKIRFVYPHQPPQEINLYYNEGSDKVFSDRDSYKYIALPILIVLPFAAVVIVAKLFGY